MWKNIRRANDVTHVTSRPRTDSRRYVNPAISSFGDSRNQSGLDMTIPRDFSDVARSLTRLLRPYIVAGTWDYMYMRALGVTLSPALHPRPRKLFENFVYELSRVRSVNFALISCRFEGVRGEQP